MPKYERGLCCFCASTTSEGSADELVHLTAAFPEVDESHTQGWTAHRALAPEFDVDAPR